MAQTLSMADRVRRQFGQEYQKEVAALAHAMRGVPDSVTRNAHAALVLRRAMFLRFLEARGCLKHAYLEQRLHNQPRFYRQVWRPLFESRPTQLAALPTKLFIPHEALPGAQNVDIPNNAFTNIFQFLGRYSWVLHVGSTDATALTPDVLDCTLLGHHQQKQMGAYYTHHDVTRYMAQNSIIPFVLDAIDRRLPQKLSDNPDRYIYASLRHGVDLRLPVAIAAGLKDVSSRQCWDCPAPSEFALPTETWREHIARRTRCRDIRRRLRSQKAASVNDLIGLNLDLATLARDAILSCTDNGVVHVLLDILRNLIVVDATCGAGAFLLAALETLLPLYEACFTRLGKSNSTRAAIRVILDKNLHGLELMPEAAEVCRLKLYLRWLASVDPDKKHCPPMPTINISVADVLRPTSITRSFDIVLGNPPYVEIPRREADDKYSHLQLTTTGNLFAPCVERFAELLKPGGRLGVIVPMSAISTPRMLPLMQLMSRQFSPLYVSNFAVRPDKLFAGVDMNLSIFLGCKRQKAGRSGAKISTTRYNRWHAAYRLHLFQTLVYEKAKLLEELGAIPKMGSALESRILNKLRAFGSSTPWLPDGRGGESIYCHSGGRYFRKCLRTKLSNEYHEIQVRKGWGDALLCLLSSSLYYSFWLTISDCFHVTRRDVLSMRVPASLVNDGGFHRFAHDLEATLWKHADHRPRRRQNGRIAIEVNFHVAPCRPVLDAIDQTLANHYGLTPAELDFVLAYDRKWRS